MKKARKIFLKSINAFALTMMIVLGSTYMDGAVSIVHADERAVTLNEDTAESEGTAERWYVNMPASGTDTLTLTAQDIDAGRTSFKIYDDGGKEGKHGSYCDSTLVINVPENCRIQATGKVDLTNYLAKVYLNIYDGEKKDEDRLCNLTGYTKSIGPYYTTGQTMTVYFKNDGAYCCDGLFLTIDVIADNTYSINCADADGGTISASPESAKMGTEVTLTAAPETDYLLKDLSIVDDKGQKVSYTRGWMEDNTITFTMPGGNVTVTPVFTDTWTAEGGLFVKIPDNGRQTVNIPDDVRSFGVSNNVNEYGNYVNNCNGTLVLTAPEGCSMKITGRINFVTDSGDGLRIYNGTEADENSIIAEYKGAASSMDQSVSLESSGRNLTLKFYTNYSLASYGVEFTITVINPDAEYKVNIIQNANGDLFSSKDKAKYGEKVTLTAAPKSGYLLESVTVECGNRYIDVDGGKWYSDNTASFLMPDDKVTVNSQFYTTGYAYRSVNIPHRCEAEKPLVATIPESVASFRVYSSNGTANISKDSDGYLLLKAPKGRIKLTGEVPALDGGDYLTVYDGTTTAVQLGSEKYSESYGNKNIGTLISTGKNMLLHFVSDSTGNGNALRLKADVVGDYDVNVSENIIGGRVDVSKESAYAGERITVTVEPDENMEIGSVSYNDGIDDHEIIPDEDGKYVFTLPARDVTVKAVFGLKFSSALNIDDLIYDGKEHTSVTVKYGDTVLTEGSDYEIIKFYKDSSTTAVIPKSAGTYCALVKGKGSYAGEKAVGFTINRKPVTVTVSVNDMAYTRHCLVGQTFLNGSVIGKEEGDEVNVDFRQIIASIETADVGMNKPLIIDGKVYLMGSDAGNYELSTQPTGITINIVKANINPLNINKYVRVGDTLYEDLNYGYYAEGKFGEISITSGAEVIDGTPIINDSGVLVVKIKDDAAENAVAKLSIPVTDFDNYNDTYINVEIVTILKKSTLLTISGTVNDKLYAYLNDKILTLTATAMSPGTGNEVWTWDSRNPEIAEFEKNNGILTLKGIGGTYITVTYDSDTTKGIRGTGLLVSVAPSAKTGLIYDGKDKALVDEGKTEVGTIQYAMTETRSAPDDDLYSADIPRAKEIGEYYVWYRLVEEDVVLINPRMLTVSILKEAPVITEDSKEDPAPGKDDNFRSVRFDISTKDEEQKPLVVEINTIRHVDYNSKKHVSNYNKVKKSSIGDVSISVNSISENNMILAYATPTVKFKNNKKATPSDNSITDKKKPCFILGFKAQKNATKTQKKVIKKLNKELKTQPVYFEIEPADLSKATVTAKVNTKKQKITKVKATINGITMKLSKKDYTYEFVGDEVYVVGKGNFKSRQKVN